MGAVHRLNVGRDN